jgi:DNA polymerase-1
MPVPRVFLIDGTAFCYRAFYAIRGLATAGGRPTNAVYGFARMLQALRDKERPDGLAVAFDVGKPTFRHKRFEAYKEHRKPMPDQLVSQLPLIKRLLAAYRVPVYEREGFEAEDVLGTMAGQLVGEGAEVFLVTGDKDLLQLVNSHIKVYNPHQKEDGILDAAAVQARYGIGPDRMVDLLALMGDVAGGALRPAGRAAAGAARGAAIGAAAGGGLARAGAHRHARAAAGDAGGAGAPAA